MPSRIDLSTFSRAVFDGNKCFLVFEIQNSKSHLMIMLYRAECNSCKRFLFFKIPDIITRRFGEGKLAAEKAGNPR